MVGYNVQAAVDTTNHLIVAHEVSNVGTDEPSARRCRKRWSSSGAGPIHFSHS
jgi:hypothetical protein